MRRITLWLLGTITSVVLLFSYHTSTSSAGAAPTTVIAGQASGSGQADSGTSSGSTSSDSSGQSSSGSSGSSFLRSSSARRARRARRLVRLVVLDCCAKTYAGDTAQTQWGPVQVQITVKNGKITASDVLQVPSGNPRDDEINSYAVPVLNSEVVATQNANIDMVSGATVTSDGYIQSLQSALDQAGL